ncbi:hypothetical protein SFC55_26200 [Niallia taxi]
MLENNTFRIVMLIAGLLALGGTFYYIEQNFGGYKEIMDAFSSFRLKKY